MAEETTTEEAKPDIEKIMAELESTRGEAEKLRAKNQELLGEVKPLKELAGKFKDVDIDSLLSLKTQVEQDEILSLAAQGKHSEAIEKATEKVRLEQKAAQEKWEKELEEARTSAQTNEQRLHELLIDGGAKSQFVELGGRKTAMDDIALRAKSVWRVEEGKPVARDASGQLLQGEAGPITMKEWIASQKETAPHLFEDSAGSGLSGSGGGSSGSLDDQIIAAANAKNFAKVRELREKQEKSRRSR